MKTLGIDIGSSYIKSALIVEGHLVCFNKTETSFNPLERCRELLRETPADRVIATGYGRHLLEVHGDIRTVTEIKAFARGARAMFPACRTIIDIGGQDTKVICLNQDGKVWKFEMNDRCAAGTGKFMDIMAKTLGYLPHEFGSKISASGIDIQISSMCTVFAESEVTSLIAKGVKREEIGTAIHRAIATRIGAMAKRFPLEDDVVFAGGCARNRCLKEFLEQSLGRPILVADTPEITGALGAALLAEHDCP